MIRGHVDRVVWVIANPGAMSRASESNGRELAGELVLKAEHSGDCFYDFEILRIDACGIGETYETGNRQCGYESGLMHSGVTLTPQEYHRLLGGVRVNLSRVKEKLNKAAQVACLAYDCSLEESAAWLKKMTEGRVSDLESSGWTDFLEDQS